MYTNSNLNKLAQKFNTNIQCFESKNDEIIIIIDGQAAVFAHDVNANRAIERAVKGVSCIDEFIVNLQYEAKRMAK